MTKAHARLTGTPTSDIFRRFFSALIGTMPWKVAVTLALIIGVGLTEGVGLLLLAPLLQVIGLDVGQGAVGRLAELVASVFDTVGVTPTLISVLGLYVLVVGARTLLSRQQTISSLALQQEFITGLRQRLYAAITNTDWLFFSRSRSSDFSHALLTETIRVGISTTRLLFLVADAVIATVYILLAVAVSASVTGLVFACGAGLLLLLRGKGREAHASGKEISEASKSLQAATSEHLSGMKTVKSYGAQDRNVDIFSKLNERVARAYVDSVRHQAEATSRFGIGSVLILSLILYVSIEVAAISMGGLLLLLFSFARIMPRLSGIQQSYQLFVTELPAFGTIMEMQARCEAAAEPEPARSQKDIELRSGIRLEGVSFAYEKRGEAFVVSDLDLTIQAGETTAIVGPSGAGKSTVADLVMGLILPDEGRVLVDETPLGAERMRAWRSRIGYVPQDTFLFHDTVRANLLWACPDASDGEIHEALRLAAAEDFVSRLPQGAETVVGDRGVRLSGGERQRLALARALLRKPSLLILDEATSNLDSENERRIQRAIEELHGSMTILVITHRLLTVQRADVIYVLEQGRIVESGDGDTLIAKENGRFLALCRAQFANTDSPPVKPGDSNPLDRYWPRPGSNG